ncbi:MAG TPA: HEAT repeat domain-containing protein [Verrucomicrobiota bacterium]|nr:heme-binding domain-containing protein [Verrucomicrobiales bacterium]HRI14413.1 HEAT repeat domain-containing protein [Verrucomicrobiota bacterium]
MNACTPIRARFAALLVNLGAAFGSLWAADYTATDRQPTPEELKSLSPVASAEKAAALLKEVQFPPEFDVTIFATPPAVNYPVFVAAAPDGTLYVSSDGNGSLDRKPHLGRVLRVRDTDGDGQADQVTAFVPDVDSPRGLAWDYDRLYLLHPPDISVFIDHDGDGVAEEQKTLVSGIAFTFKDRPADHSSNGLELGIDGWLYAAIGDFGFMEATGTDGKKLQLRGGGVVRVRPDGTGLEVFAEGTRNILEVAMSPLLDGFARDNTNDGGGWDVRLHHFSGYTRHGYPRLFKNFPEEIVQPLADYGGGSGCGAAWIDEPGIPAAWNNAPFTADWGTEWIYHHGLTVKGATFDATQEKFAKLPRVTDLDVDAHSAIYAASWKGASFTWVGPEVGFLVRATPRGFTSPPLPDFNKASNEELLSLLESPSHRRRLAAQRELIRRYGEGIPLPMPVRTSLRILAGNPNVPLASRIAATFALQQTLGVEAPKALADLAGDPTLAPWIIRALTDRGGDYVGVPTAPILAALGSPDPRTRREASVAIGRLGDAKRAPELVPLLADPDPIVAHTAVQSLIRLRASDACLAVVDDQEATPAMRSGSLRVLQALPETAVVEALLSRLSKETDPQRRAHLITALCRLHWVEGPWKGDSWGTRPDTRGPFYQPETWSETFKIAAALKATLASADSKEAAHVGRELARHRIPAGEALDLLVARARADSSLLPAIAAQLSQAEDVPAAAVPLLVKTATAADTPDAVRAQAVIALVKTDKADAWRAVLVALPLVQKTKTENNLAEKARNAFNNSVRLESVPDVFAEQAAKVAGEPSFLAEVALLKLAARKVGSPEVREVATKALDSGWSDPKRRVQILRAAAEARDTSRAAQFVAALEDPDSDVAQAAKETVKRLKIDPEKIRADAQSPRVGELAVNDVIAAAITTRGDATRGEQLFLQVGCTSCHTVKADEPLKGPFLGTIATTYQRPALAEAILVPNKTIAQGFVANHFELKDGSEVDGFVVREAADAVTIRTITAQEQTVAVGDIAKRERQERSLMPEGLAAGLTVKELASLLDYLESLAAKP